MIHRTNTKTGSSFFLILMMTLVTVLSFSMKEAQAAHKPIGVTFKKLNITVKKIEKRNGHRLNEVTVEYAVRRSDWKQIKRHNIRPQLTFATRRNSRVKNFSLNHRKGRLQFHTSAKIKKNIELRVSGKNRGVYIDENGYKAQCDRWLRIPVKRFRRYDHDVSYDHNPRHPRNENLYAVMQSCKARGLSKVRCSKLMRKVGQKRAPKIFRACAANTKWSSDFERCAKTAATVAHKPAKAVYACAGPSDGWNSNLVSCLKTVATINYNPSSLIRACDVATKWFSDFKSCVQTAAPVADSTNVVQACDRATKWGSDLRGCIKSARGLHDPAHVVSMCDQATDYPSDLKRCVKRGGPYAKRHTKRRVKTTYKKKRYTRR